MTAGGAEFNGPLYQDTWITPDTHVLMLRPMCLYPDWSTSNAGNYARLALTDFGLTAGTGGWYSFSNGSPTAQTRMKNASMAGPVFSTTTWGKNRGFFVSFFNYNTGNDDQQISFECGWANSGAPTLGVQCRFWAGGKVEIWKDNAIVGEYQLGGNTANGYVDLLLMPMRRRELYILNIRTMESITHVFTDIDEDEADPTITGATSFFFEVPSPMQVNVEVAPVKFATTGYATSLEIALMAAPETGAAFETWINPSIPSTAVTNARVYADSAHAGATSIPITGIAWVKLDGTAFTADGVLRDGRIKVTLNGDGAYSPFVYGVHMGYAAVVELTDDSEEFELLPYILDATLDVPDDPAGVTFRCTVKDPEGIEALVPGFLASENWPVRILIGDVVVIDGITMPLRFTDGEHGEVMRGQLEIRDRIALMGQLMFRERMIFDGWWISQDDTLNGPSIARFLYKAIAIADAEMELEDVSYRVGDVPSFVAGEWNYIAPVGSTPLSEMQRLTNEFFSTAFWGMRPTATVPEAVFLDPDNFSGTPDLTIYRTHEDAVTAGKTEEEADDFVYWTFEQEPLPIEANEVRMTGMNPRTGQIIQSYIEDTASKDPTTVPSARPDNWLGAPRVFGVVNPRFTRQEDTDRAAAYVFPQVSERHWVAEWTSSMLFKAAGVPIWRGDLIDLDGRGEFRVSSLSIRFEKEPNDAESDTVVFRSATYTGGTITNGGGTGLRQIQARAKMRAVNKVVDKSGGLSILGMYQARTVQEAP
jgi:hypothetical protein